MTVESDTVKACFLAYRIWIFIKVKDEKDLRENRRDSILDTYGYCVVNSV